MQSAEYIDEQVHKFYWEDDYNCAITSLKTLSNIYKVELSEQVVNAAKGMHGAGKYGAQCGLVEGTLMFIGIFGTQCGFNHAAIVKSCYQFAKSFEEQFGSLKCSDLRAGGFQETDPPHLCEKLTCEALLFTHKYIEKIINQK